MCVDGTLKRGRRKELSHTPKGQRSLTFKSKPGPEEAFDAAISLEATRYHILPPDMTPAGKCVPTLGGYMSTLRPPGNKEEDSLFPCRPIPCVCLRASAVAMV